MVQLKNDGVLANSSGVATMTTQGWLSLNNVLFGPQDIITPLLVLGPGTDSGVSAAGGGPLGAGAFALTEKVTLTHSGAGSSSFDKMLTAVVPEPTSVVLIGVGAALFAASRRRRNKKASV